ncbi:FadR/GntR family transcriptional regulator [Jiella sonneratiae]|uniref:Pyruvate dehydrogenase complex repressor n=1 Tax=Jiella sonneratiae TaxID=2816856 RepID=A0ABS3J219_9HYPH|nr:FCD domain-containing protein [Jiella sonneratiae]MBO0903719.1 FadR family transcriptional regulator [Jiella sonneratiae]
MSSEASDAKPYRGKPRTSLADRVYHLLYSRISNGDYAANGKLPTEAKLALEFDVSRPVLRAALERLRADGLVYSRQGAGSYVRSPRSKSLGFAKVETIADIQRCYEFRLTIETEAAFMAAERRNEAVMGEIQEALDLLDVATGSLTHREDADFAFHLAVTRAANNQYYEASMRALREHIHVGMKMHGQSLMSDAPKGLREVLAEHNAIFAAIRERRARDAREAMRQHIINSRDRLFGGQLIDLSL